MRAQRTSDDLEQMTAQKMALERDVTELQNDIHQLKANEETMVAEKWELSAANADLQNRMQTMAITYMQVYLKKIFLLLTSFERSKLYLICNRYICVLTNVFNFIYRSKGDQMMVVCCKKSYEKCKWH